MIASRIARLPWLMAVVLLPACGDQVIPPEAAPELDASLASIATNEVIDLSEVRIELPGQLRDWERSDEALVRAIAERGNRAIVGLKDPLSPRVYKTGKRAAISAHAIREGLTALQRMGAELIRYHSSIGSVTITIDPDMAPTVRRHPAVDYIEPRIEVELASLPRRLVSAGQTTPWGIDLVRAPQAWLSTTGAGASLMILDTGYDRGHVDLPVIPLANCSGIVIPCQDSPQQDWHGTHVLGIAAALDNTTGVVGVAHGLKAGDIYVSDVCEPDGQGGVPCYTDYVIEALDQAAGWGVGVVNMSFTFPDTSIAVPDAVARAWSADVVLVAAAGNDNKADIHPAAYQNVIGVSGVKPDMSFADSNPCRPGGSRWGSHVDLAAPFWANSTIGYTDKYYTHCGTSQSAPHVAGVAALLRAQHPAWTNQQVVDRLFQSANDQGDPGKDPYFGHGIVDAEAALMGAH